MNRRLEAASTLTLLSFLLGGCCQAGQPCQNTGSWPSNGEIVGASIGIVAAVGAVGVGTAIAVNHAHHRLQGCVSTGPDGLQLTRDSDKKTFSLVGADVKSGQRVKLHGTKKKKGKGNPGNQEFVVDKVTKDLGPCVAIASSVPAPNPVSNH